MVFEKSFYSMYKIYVCKKRN